MLKKSLRISFILKTTRVAVSDIQIAAFCHTLNSLCVSNAIIIIKNTTFRGETCLLVAFIQANIISMTHTHSYTTHTHTKEPPTRE